MMLPTINLNVLVSMGYLNAIASSPVKGALNLRFFIASLDGNVF